MIKKLFPAVVLSALLPVFISCASVINGSLKTDGQADLDIRARLQPMISIVIRNLAAASGNAARDAPVLNGPEIARSMSSVPGIASVTFKNESPTAIEGPLKISRISDFLSNGNAGDFISFEQKNAAGEGYCAVNLSLDSGPRILGLLSPEISGYLELLMAPIKTGDKMTKKEYLDLISTFYGRAIADEISNSSIRAAVNFPGAIRSVKGGTFSGTRADFEIPLLDVLVLETPLNYEVVWK